MKSLKIRILICVLSITLALGGMICAIVLPICLTKKKHRNDDYTHTHKLIFYVSKEPTCLEEGNIDYYYCARCGKFFADENAETELESVSIPANGHTFNTAEWISDGTHHWHKASCEHTDAISPKEKHVYDKDGLCTVCKYDGNKYVTLYIDGILFEQQKSVDGKITLPEDISTNPDSKIYYDGWYYDKNLTEQVTDFTFTESVSIYAKEYTIDTNNFAFKTSNGEATVINLVAKQSEVLVIPRFYNGLPVTAIGKSACTGAQARKVVMFDGIKKIGSSAFSDCVNMTSVTIPNSITLIENNTFSGCSNLVNAVIPDSVEYIGYEAFKDCGGLIDVTIGNGVYFIDYQVLTGCLRLTSITYNGTKAQWDDIVKISSWSDYAGIFKIHCTDGDI